MATEVQSYPEIKKEDDLTLRDIVVRVRMYFLEIMRNWKIVLLITIPILTYLIAAAFLTPKKFIAELTFMVNEDEGSKIGGVADVLESLGVVSGGSNSEYNLEKILELAKSQRILFACLMKKATIKDKEDYFANHIIRTYNLHKEWKKDKPKLANFLFTRDSLPTFSRLENSALKAIYKLLLGEGGNEPLLTTVVLENSGIMSLTLKSRNEELSAQMSRVIFEELSNFYVSQTTKKQRETYKKVSEEADSIRAVLKAKEFELATFVDTKQGLITQRSQLQRDQIERDVFVLNTMYGEAVANEEVAKFALKNRTPFILPIDLPVEPLKQVRSSKLTAGITGLVVGLILASIFIIGRRLYLDTMSEEDADRELGSSPALSGQSA